MTRSWHLAGLLLAILLTLAAPIAAFAAPVADTAADLRALDAYVGATLELARAGDLSAAATEFEQFRSGWPAVEDAVRAQSRTTYSGIEEKMGDARYALTHNDAATAITALTALRQLDASFIAGDFAADSAAPAPQDAATIATLIALLDQTQAALQKGDMAAAKAAVDGFKTTWPNVEGEIKTRSTAAYSATENNMAQLSGLIGSGDAAGAATVAAAMRDTLLPFNAVSNYGLFDATIILLREGLEALLVVAALLAFLNRSGNQAKRGWIWAGGLLGVAGSLLTAVVITLVFQGISTGSNRELIEGFTGLFAAAMLFYVSYWLHSKSHIGAWQQYIRARTSAALATGSLFSLGLLAFLAVYREGAETALFYIGIAPHISLQELAGGIGIAVALLLLIGVAMFRLGVRIPMRPFFLVTSGLIFYLGFKFIGTGVHALQVAGIVPATPAPYLVEFDLLGLFPTWETTSLQLMLLVGAAVITLLSRRAHRPTEQKTAAVAAE